MVCPDKPGNAHAPTSCTGVQRTLALLPACKGRVAPCRACLQGTSGPTCLQGALGPLSCLQAVNLRANQLSHFPAQLRVARRTAVELHLVSPAAALLLLSDCSEACWHRRGAAPGEPGCCFLGILKPAGTAVGLQLLTRLLLPRASEPCCLCLVCLPACYSL